MRLKILVFPDLKSVNPPKTEDCIFYNSIAFPLLIRIDNLEDNFAKINIAKAKLGVKICTYIDDSDAKPYSSQSTVVNYGPLTFGN